MTDCVKRRHLLLWLLSGAGRKIHPSIAVLSDNIGLLFALQVAVSIVPRVWGDTVSICSLLISFLSSDALAHVEKLWEVSLINWQTFPLFVSAEQTLMLKSCRKKKPLLINDVVKVNERRNSGSNTVWTANEASNLLMNMTSESFLPTIPWGLILKKKTSQCLMIAGTLGWAPTLINEPHLQGASIPGDTMVMSSHPNPPLTTVSPPHRPDVKRKVSCSYLKLSFLLRKKQNVLRTCPQVEIFHQSWHVNETMSCVRRKGKLLAKVVFP